MLRVGGTAAVLLQRRSYSVLFMGSERLAASVLRRVVADGHEVTVLTAPERRRGRGGGSVPTEVAREASSLGARALSLDAAATWRDWAPPQELQRDKFDVGVVVEFGYFLPDAFLRTYLANGAINFHPSDLPRYRGAAPLRHALLNGDDYVGLSVIEIDPVKADTGHVLARDRMDVSRSIAYPELYRAVCERAPPLVSDVLANLEERKRTAVPQTLYGVKPTRAPKVHRSDGALDPFNQTAKDAENKIRALSDLKYTAVWIRGERVILYDGVALHALDEANNSVLAAPGSIAFNSISQTVDIRFREGILRCATLQRPNRARMHAAGFARSMSIGGEPVVVQGGARRNT